MAPNSPLSKPSVVAHILQDRGIDPKYSLGQNFLVNDNIIGRILSLSDVSEGDNVLEIGPGMGVLTLALLMRGARVIAVEKDSDMVEILRSNVEQFCPQYKNNLHILHDDAINIDYKQIVEHFGGEKFKLIANLPYAIAATVILNAFQQVPNLTSTTTMVQKEVADRISAKPNSKDYGAYTVKLRFYACVSGRFNVAPNNFFPAPRVTSSVIRLEKSNVGETLSYDRDEQILNTACILADAAFSHRRKTLQNSCKQYFADNLQLDIDFDDLLEACQRENIELGARAEIFNPQDFLRLAKSLRGLYNARCNRGD